MKRMMNPTLTLNHLLERRLIDQAQYRACHEEIKAGSNVIHALHLFSPEAEVWRHFATQGKYPFYPTIQDLRVIFSDLIDHKTALQYGILPHRTRGQDLQVVTFDPSAMNGIHEAFPGRVVQHALIPPSQWRALFELLYPASLIGQLSELLAQALVTFTPTGADTTMTPEQTAEVLALTRQLRYIDLRTDPPDDDVRHLVTLPTMALSMAYPHHLEGGTLVMLMSNPEDTAAIERLTRQTRLRIVPAIVTEKVIDSLLRQEQTRETELNHRNDSHQTLLEELGIALPGPLTDPHLQEQFDSTMKETEREQQALLALFDELGAPSPQESR